MTREEKNGQSELNRRQFLRRVGQGAAVAAAGAILGDVAPAQAEAASPAGDETRVVHSVCLACNAVCGVRGEVRGGRLQRVSGNPYHPYNMAFAPIDQDTPPAQSLAVPSPVCGKCQDTVNHTESPYRLVRPLKRCGPRGSGQFEPIEWDRLVAEIAEGGRHFAHIGEERQVPGLKELLSDDPIDPAAPELGSRRNGLVFVTGRLQTGRQQFIDRFVKGAVGSINRIGHTDICGLGFRMGNFALTQGKEIELKADPLSAAYILVFGANVYEALQPGINTYGALMARRQAEGGLRFAVIDPRATRAAVHADAWLPVRPGRDGALALGLARTLLDENLCNLRYLSAPSAQEAKRRGFGSCTNAPCLVIVDPRHPENGRMLRLKDLDPSKGGQAGETLMVLDAAGQVVAADATSQATLEAKTVATDYFGNAWQVETAFSLLRAGIEAHAVETYADEAGVDAAELRRVAREFAAAGTRGAVTQYHGAGNYICGVHAAYAVALLSALVGSPDMRGGYLKGGGGAGDCETGLYNLKEFPGQRKPGGAAISREKFAYEKTSEYKKKKAAGASPYPARLPWFPFSAGGLSNEALIGLDAGYPYKAQVLFTYLYNGVYSAPGGTRFRETLLDAQRTPLHVSIDTAINETNLYADYIVPDLCWPEGHHGWLTPHAPALRFTAVRTPVMEPLTGRTADGRPFGTETLLIDLAQRLGLPGFGDAAIPGADGAAHPLRTAEDFYLRAFANLAHNAKGKPAIDADVAFVEGSYPIAAHKDLLPGDQWRAVCRILARGGVFRPYDDVFEGERFTRGIERYMVYNETLARTKDSMTGRRLPGSPVWMPPQTGDGGDLAAIDGDYPLTLVTYKRHLHTQSRSLWYSRAMAIVPDNAVEMHPDDAAGLGLAQGDRVRLASASNPEGVVGRLQLTRMVRPGCVAVSFHFGHTQFGGTALAVKDAASVFLGGAAVADGDRLTPREAYRAGINPNDVARLDPALGNTPLTDAVAGIPDFSSTRVRVAKETA